MVKATVFKMGDVVHHPRRREWGAGVVEKVSSITHEGCTAQRLVVTFKHHGRVTINTGVAPLVDKESDANMSRSHTTAPAREGGWLAAIEQASEPHELWALPEAMTDPFASLQRRLAATLESYRHGRGARGLIDWAITQTRLDDPMTKYTRHELEQAFDRFDRDRLNHLKDLVRQVKRQRQTKILNETLRSMSHPEARSALQNVMRS